MIRALVLVFLLAACPSGGGGSRGGGGGLSGGGGDTDGDGLLDDVDKCPSVPEDFDGFEDADGCPEADNDRDGVPDVADRCPSLAENVDGVDDGDGCPEGGGTAPPPANPGALPPAPVADDDPDKDGIKGPDDKCPNEPEVYNGVTDGDGCPP